MTANRHTVSRIAIIAMAVGSAVAAEPDQVARWKEARINPARSIQLDKAVALYQRTADRYLKVEKMRPNGIPAQILFTFHVRESDASFRHHPHEGSTLQHRTRYVPKGRLPAPAQPPFTWDQSAEDAYYTYEKLDRRNWNKLQTALQAMESFNGLGYQRPGKPPSPYLWAATTIERPGKYIADGKYSATARDAQLGCAAILKRMEQRGMTIPRVFTGAPMPAFRLGASKQP